MWHRGKKSVFLLHKKLLQKYSWIKIKKIQKDYWIAKAIKISNFWDFENLKLKKILFDGVWCLNVYIEHIWRSCKSKFHENKSFERLTFFHRRSFEVIFWSFDVFFNFNSLEIKKSGLFHIIFGNCVSELMGYKNHNLCSIAKKEVS